MTRRLVRGRRVRAICVAAGVVVAGLPSYMNLIDAERSSSFAKPLVGYAWLFGATGGAVLAEVFVVQRPSRRQASLVVRSAGDYVDRRFIQAVYSSFALMLVLAAIATAFDWWRWWEAWVGVGASAVAAASVHFGVRATVRRPALAPGGELRDVDDALRADGAFRVVGAAVALSAASFTTVNFGDARGVLSALSIALGFVSYYGLSLWWTLADVKWSVHRARALQ